MTSSTPYDEINYPDSSFPQSHPDRLAMLGLLLGMTPAPVQRARVLELGCAAGANLIPMAYQYPEATFVGIDYAETQVAQGRETIAALGLTNIRLEALNFLDVDHDALGEFDYILAHGIYSWVPPDVQQAMLAIYKRQLAPQGVGYLSYNALPGWRLYGVAREAMMYRTRKITDLRERARVAREYFAGIAGADRTLSTDDAWSRYQKSYDMLLKAQADYLEGKTDRVFVHDELEYHNEALYFWQVVERLEAAGLQFLCETEFPLNLPTNLQPAVQEFLRAHCSSLQDVEQTMDFLRGRTFRQSLIVHDDIEVDRRLGLHRLAPMYFASRMRRTPTEGTDDAGQVTYHDAVRDLYFSTPDPITIHALDQLIRTYPHEYRLAELVENAREAVYAYQMPPRTLDEDLTVLATTLLQAFSRSYTMMEMRSSPAPMLVAVSERPVASAYARYQAIGGFEVTNQRSEHVVLDRHARFLISRLDGTHTIDQLTRALAEEVVLPRQAKDAAPELRQRVVDTLQMLARSALLIG